jgi:hypothetical protein
MRCTTPRWMCDAMRCDVCGVDRRQPKKHVQTTSHTQGELAPWEGPGIRRGELPRSSPRSRRRLTKDYAGDGEGGAPVCRSSERDRRETSQEPGQHCTAQHTTTTTTTRPICSLLKHSSRLPRHIASSCDAPAAHVHTLLVAIQRRRLDSSTSGRLHASRATMGKRVALRHTRPQSCLMPCTLAATGSTNAIRYCTSDHSEASIVNKVDTND